jgi:hypothetical protein
MSLIVDGQWQDAIGQASDDNLVSLGEGSMTLCAEPPPEIAKMRRRSEKLGSACRA